MEKIRVLVVPSDKTGVGAFRSVKPHVYLDKVYSREFTVNIDYQPKYYDDQWLKQFDIIHFHKTFGPYEDFQQTMARLKKLGIVAIMDIDDYWLPPKTHPAHILITNAGLPEKIVNNLRHAPYVMTTTKLFAKVISKINENVFVIPNAVDINEHQYIPQPTKSDRLRIGWVGGSSHEADLNLLKGLVNKLKSDGLMDKIQFVLGGFDTRGTITDIDRKTGEKKTRNIKPIEGVWYRYEKIFTDDHTTVSPEYKEFLLKFKNEEYPNVENEPYRRVWTKPITSYATIYNYCDVSLAPLVENLFNSVKSELKVIEAGFYKKLLIAQNFGPYTINTKNALIEGGIIDTEGNTILIDSHKNHKGWYNAIKRIIKKPELIELLGENLNKFVIENYSMEVVTQKRVELYKSLLKK